MMRIAVSVVLCAGFVVLFGLVVPSRRCSGHCAGCTGTCERYGSEGDDDVR